MSTKRTLVKHSAKTLGFKTDAEMLVGYLQGELTEEDLLPSIKEKLQKVLVCKALLLEHLFIPKVLPILIKLYGSESTAYRIIRLTEKVIGPLHKAIEDVKRAIAESMIMQDREMAKQLRNPIASSASTNNFMKLYGLDRSDPEMPDTSNFEFHTLIIAVMPSQVGINPPEDEILMKQYKDWTNSAVEDIEHEQV